MKSSLFCVFLLLILIFDFCFANDDNTLTDEEKEKARKEKIRNFERGMKNKLDKPVLRQESDSIHMVIVRWNENLTWVRDFFSDVDTSVVQKANDPILDNHLHSKLREMSTGQLINHQELTLDSSFHKQRVDTPYLDGLDNVEFDYISNTQGLGRECSGYIWWILEHYDDLPTWTMFVHGAPEKSAFLARQYLTKPKGEFQSFAGNIVNRCFEKYNGEEGRAGGEFFVEEWAKLMEEIDLTVPHCIRNFCCANFVAHKSRIRILSKDHWRKLLLYVLLKAPGPGWRNNCYHLEHFWHMLMGEPSHTYIGFAPHPDSSASKILSDTGEEKITWEEHYRPYMKPEKPVHHHKAQG